MNARIRRIGNSQGVILPKPLLAQIGVTGPDIEMGIERDAIVLRKPKKGVRSGWAAAAKRLARHNDDTLVWPYLENEDDAALEW